MSVVTRNLTMGEWLEHEDLHTKALLRALHMGFSTFAQIERLTGMRLTPSRTDEYGLAGSRANDGRWVVQDYARFRASLARSRGPQRAAVVERLDVARTLYLLDREAMHETITLFVDVESRWNNAR